MYKNQLQELAQRSCFNLPSYACVKEGPNHAPRFKACVNFNGEIFESQTYCNTLRQAEHSAAELALNVLSSRGPSRSLTARVLDETGIYKNLLQETAHRAGLKLPVYTTVRSGPGHVPTFTCSVEIAGLSFNGDSAKTKKQAEKNAAISAWSALSTMHGLVSMAPSNNTNLIRGVSPQNVERLKLMGLIVMDLGQQTSLQKHTNFASLVPPPPPRTASKILPPQPNRSIPVQVRPIRSSHSSNVMEEHAKDELEWLGQKQKNPITSTSTSTTTDPSKESYYNTSKFKSFSSSSSSQRCAQLHPHKIAPAVHIRSVVPVCSAPPQPQSKPRITTVGQGESQLVSSSSSSSPPNNEPIDL